MYFNLKETKNSAIDEYQRWIDHTADNSEFQAELRKLHENNEEISDSFYTDLVYGPYGLKGLTGPGTNRINEYVIRRATQGLADYLAGKDEECLVAIAYDCRKKSEFFASEAASVLKGNGIKTFLFSELTPAPVLSYAIRVLKCSMGIMITADCEQRFYNGYRIYNQDGYGIIGKELDDIKEAIGKLDYFDGIKYEKAEKKQKLTEKVRDSYTERIAAIISPDDPEMLTDYKSIYSPLNGTGGKYVKDVFDKIGYTDYSTVRVQEYPDQDFRTCPMPNPRKILAFDEGFKLMDVNGGDLLLATSPDSASVGAALYHDGVRTLLSGNQLGLLMLDYLCHIEPPAAGQVVIKSIMTSPLVNKMAQKYGLRVMSTLSGSQYIGETLSKLEKAGKLGCFYFGFQECNGFFIDPYLHGNDGIAATLLILQVAAFHEKRGKDLIDRMNEIYKEFGQCIDKQRNYNFSGAEGKIKMDSVMRHMRRNVNVTLGNKRIIRKIDYLENTGLPPANILEFDFEDDSRLIIHPSSVESRLKIYSFETRDFADVEREIVKVIERFR